MKITDWLKSMGLTPDSDIEIPSSTDEPQNKPKDEPGVESKSISNTENNKTKTLENETDTGNQENISSIATQELLEEIKKLKAANFALLTQTTVQKESSVDECIYNLCMGGNLNGNSES